MAWRLHQSVIRGEIDNRVRGQITGRIWLVGRPEPLELRLAGNAERDLAGRRLEFINPSPVAEDFGELATRQTGVIGDCTASRKMKVPDVPPPLQRDDLTAKKPGTWHCENNLILEWYSDVNGRVIIESFGYQLVISPESTWEMTTEEVARRSAGLPERRIESNLPFGPDDDVESKLPDAASHAAAVPPPSSAPASEPLTEGKAEPPQDGPDRRLDRMPARLARDHTSASLAALIEVELKRRREERGDQPFTPDDLALRERWMRELNRAAAESVEKLEGFLSADLWGQTHPLVDRTHALVARLTQEPQQKGWVPADATEEHPLVDIGLAAGKATAKLAIALNGGGWPPSVGRGANTIVRLKRARSYLADAASAAAVAHQQELGDPSWIATVQRELDGLLQECDDLIAELRGRLESGFP